MRAKHAIPAALLAACSAEAVGPLDARDVAFLRAAQAQAVRIAAMTDEEVQPIAERPRPELASLDQWLELLRCRDRPTIAARADCTAGAARLHEAAERLIRGRPPTRL